MTPAHRHISFDELLSAGWLAISTVGLPGTQGATVFGMQGMGVNTPIAAAVADATVGFAGLRHMANGMMFIMGLLSMIVAAGWLLVSVRFMGSTTSELGAKPMEHCSIAPLQTCIPIELALLARFWSGNPAMARRICLAA